MSDSDPNTLNLEYFENASMHLLYEQMKSWQIEKGKRFLSMSIQRDGQSFCCIAVTNPMEVVITDGIHTKNRVKVSEFGTMFVSNM